MYLRHTHSAILILRQLWRHRLCRNSSRRVWSVWPRPLESYGVGGQIWYGRGGGISYQPNDLCLWAGEEEASTSFCSGGGSSRSAGPRRGQEIQPGACAVAALQCRPPWSRFVAERPTSITWSVVWDAWLCPGLNTWCAVRGTCSCPWCPGGDIGATYYLVHR